jgi:hypothetical protein
MGVKLTNTTRVQVMVEVCGMSQWGMEATLESVHASAKQEALNRLTKALKIHDVRIVGDMRVLHIVSEADPIK